MSERTGVPMPEPVAVKPGVSAAGAGKVGFAGLFSAHYLLPTIVLGLMSATGLVLVYSLNTWLPEIMLRAGFNAKGSLSFLAVLNGGSLFGALAASRAADRFGPKPVVAACFATGAVALVLLTLGFPLAGLLAHRRRRRSGYQRYADADLRLRRQLLPHQRARRRRWLGVPVSAAWAASAARCWAAR